MSKSPKSKTSESLSVIANTADSGWKWLSAVLDTRFATSLYTRNDWTTVLCAPSAECTEGLIWLEGGALMYSCDPLLTKLPAKAFYFSEYQLTRMVEMRGFDPEYRLFYFTSLFLLIFRYITTAEETGFETYSFSTGYQYFVSHSSQSTR